MSQEKNASRSLTVVRHRVAQAEVKFKRAPGDVRLLAVSKTKPVEEIRGAIAAGQADFGENYLNEALTKIEQLAGQGCRWHYIGSIQSNKTRALAENFDWIHTVDRLKIAQRLSDQRPDGPPLNICVQVNIDSEASKSGATPDAVEHLCAEIIKLPRLTLRGLMAIPRASDDFQQQRDSCRRMRLLFDTLRTQYSTIDTLSMGMSGDLEAAVAEGSTMVRIGTAIFGQRSPKPPTSNSTAGDQS